MLSLLLAAAIGLPAAGQDKNTPDGGKTIDETKLLLGNLKRLDDPEINKMLPELYWALKATEGEASGSSMVKSPRTKMPDVMSILRNPSVRHEIEMVDEQYEDFQERRSKIVRSMNEQIRSLLTAKANADPLELREKIGKIRAQAEEATEKSVLPFQFERLKQLRYHVLMRRLGAVNVLTNDPLASELGISDEQKKELREFANEIGEELAREIARLHAQAMRKLFSRLEKDQQVKLSKIMGDEFHYQEVLGKWQQHTGKGK